MHGINACLLHICLCFVCIVIKLFDVFLDHSCALYDFIRLISESGIEMEINIILYRND